MTRRRGSSNRFKAFFRLSEFAGRVYAAVRRIPAGKVATYAAVAATVGSPQAVRAVGNALHANPDPSRTPCHRVVRADGSLGGYAFGGAAKRRRLAAEGVVTVRGRVDLGRFALTPAALRAFKL